MTARVSLRRVVIAGVVGGALVPGLGDGITVAQSPAPPTLPAGAICGSRHGGGVPTTVAQWAEGAQLFAGLGDYRRAATVKPGEAQAYFDQGMRLLWAFNHDEATRSFAKAAQLDPDCAICLWGVALTVGPNYNLPMLAEARAKVASEALQQAVAKVASASPVEQALIEALKRRYPNAQPLDPAAAEPVLTAFAAAMGQVAARFPDDADVQTLAAEAAMNVNAWRLWSLAGEPAPGTAAIVAGLEAVLAKQPGHPGANHYYIHAVEASPHPEKAVAAAERLPGMMPAAGHLEHMPAHILQRVGRYADAAEANRKGAAADAAYFAKAKAPDYYAMYTAHNYQFLAFSTAMEGRKAETVEAARKARGVVADELLLAMPGADWYLTELYTGMVRFGLWDDVLAEPAPDERLVGLRFGYHYARAAALAAKGRAAEAATELAALEKIAAAAPADLPAGLNAAADVFAVAVLAAKGRLALAEGRDREAATLLTEAVAREDALAYDEPADWFVPARHMLGAVLLKAGRAAEAEAVYREDLRRNPENGWGLFGLAQALAAQGRAADAAAIRDRFTAAWKRADVTLTSSAF